MSGEATLTLIGNLTANPELRVTAGGDTVASFTVATTHRVLNRAEGKWIDGDTLFLRCSAWRQLAENVAESLNTGTRVWVQGRLKQRSFETGEGHQRSVVELDVNEIGPSLRFATATVHRSHVAPDTGRQRDADSSAPVPESLPPSTAAVRPAPLSTRAPASSTSEP